MAEPSNNPDAPKKGIDIKALIQEKKMLLIGIAAAVAILGASAFLMLGGRGGGDDPAAADPSTSSVDPAGDRMPSESDPVAGTQLGADGQIPNGTEPTGGSEPGLDVSGNGGAGGDMYDDPSTVKVNVRNWKQYVCEYSYRNMDADEQDVYMKLFSSAQSYMNSADLDAVKFDEFGIYAMEGVAYPTDRLTREQAVDVAQWFLHCNPQFWFLKPSVLSTDTTLYVGVLDEGANGIERAEKTNAIMGTVDEWLAGIPSDGSKYDTVQAVHDKLCQSVTYVEGDTDQSIYSVFVKGQTVCAGYSNAMTLLLNAKGIETVGVASDGHAWNLVCMDDGKWYGLDACWDDELGKSTFLLVSDSKLRSMDTEEETHVPMSYLSSNGWIPAVATSDYQVPGSDGGGTGAATVVVQAPSDLSVQPLGDGSLSVSWTAAAGAQEYEVSVLKDGNVLGTKTASHSPFNISGSLPSGKFTIQVRSRTVYEGMEKFSEPVSIEYDASSGASSGSGDFDEGFSPDVPVPGGLSVIETGDGFVRISWNAVDGATGYEVAVFRDSARTNKALQKEIAETNAKIEPMSPGQTVFVYVRTAMSGQKSAWVNIQATSGGTPSGDTTVGMPQNASFSVVSSSVVRLSWDSVTNASSYDVQVFEDAGYSNMKTSGRTSNTAMRLNGMSSNQAYYVQIRAIANIGGQEYFSEWTRFQASIAGGDSVSSSLGMPGNIQAGMTSSTKRLISWTAVEGAVGYDVQIGKDQAFTQILTSGRANGCTLQVDGASTSRNYWVRVRAVGVVNGQTVTGEWAVVMI